MKYLQSPLNKNYRKKNDLPEIPTGHFRVSNPERFLYLSVVVVTFGVTCVVDSPPAGISSAEATT